MEIIQIDKLEKQNIKPKTSNINFNLLHDNHPLIWLMDATYTKPQISSETMPSAIGGIATFTEKNLHLNKPIKLFKYPERFAEELEKIIPDIIGFSNYMWNSELSFSLARRMKKIKPKIIIIMGGPNYPVNPNEQETFLRTHPEIDFYVTGEGEVAFANLIANLINVNLKKESLQGELPSVHFMMGDNQLHLSTSIERIRDLSEIPSPYLEGKMDEFFDGKLQPTIQTTRGCPFSCTFCVEGLSYYSKVYRNSFEKTSLELDFISKKMNVVREKGGRNDLWLVDSNFGMYSQDIDTCKVIAKCQEQYNWPDYVHCDTGKNNKERVLDAAKLVKGAIRLSGSVQSLNPDVLKNVKRANISSDDLLQLAKDAAEVQAYSRSEIILGMPGETLESHFDTNETIVNAGFDKIDNYQLMMIPGTEVTTPENIKQFGMQTRYRILPRCSGHYKILGETICAAEIDKICTSTNSLSFVDYLECRKLHLIIEIFYNVGFFSTLLKFIKSMNLSVFDWLEFIFKNELSGNIKELFNSFESETKNELYDDRDELYQETQKQEVIESYIKGELGYNLLFVHKAVALSNYIDDLMNLAKECTLKFLEKNNQCTVENKLFVDDALNYDRCASSNIFTNQNNIPTLSVSFDLKQFNIDKTIKSLDNYKFENKKNVEFILDEEQKNILSRYVKLYGTTSLGIARILTKVFVKRLLRHPSYVEKIITTD
tara:strand:- start:660 stop:2798 length:2139 start_codon:yes stop_codon:yes gene_type:complete